MATTYEPIVTTTGDNSSLTISLNSIPSTYTDLKLIISGTNASTARIRLQFNNNAGALYNATWITTDGASVGAGTTNPGQTQLYFAYTTNPSTTIPIFIDCNILNYASSGYKTVLTSSYIAQGASGSVEKNVSCFQSTSTISSIQILGSGAWPTTTTFTLYGIKAA